MRVVIAHTKNPYIEAIHAGFRFALVNEKGQAYHYPIQCKDYFTDLGWVEDQGKEQTVYGFNWKPKTVDLEQPWHHMAITQKGLVANAAHLQRFLREIEATLGFPLSTVTPDESGEWLVVRFSRVWWLRPYLISAFTQYLRCGADYGGEGVVAYLEGMASSGKNPWCSYDVGRLAEVARRTALMLNGTLWDWKYSDYKDAYSAHGMAGLVSFDTSKNLLTTK